jgi:hypothetical protein
MRFLVSIISIRIRSGPIDYPGFPLDWKSSQGCLAHFLLEEQEDKNVSAKLLAAKSANTN